MKKNVTESLYDFDKSLLSDKIIHIGGIDEVGRGPLCGPVVVACCIMDLNSKYIDGITDSKKVSEKKRNSLYNLIIQSAIGYEVCIIDNNEIDRINILQATKKAMLYCIDKLKHKMNLCLIDAVNLDTDIPINAIIKGDATSYNIACASIIAKVTRDNLMLEYHRLYPEYNFESNKGYGTREHIDAIKKYGITPIHRKTFVKNFIN